MSGRIGMYYHVGSIPSDQHGRLALRNDREPVALAASQTTDAGMFVCLAGVIAAICLVVALVAWGVG